MMHERKVSLHELNYIISRVKACSTSLDTTELIASLLLISHEEPLGRVLLSKKLNVSERRARSLINALKSCNLINVDKVAGCFIRDDIVKRIILKINIIELRLDTTYISIIGPFSDEIIECIDTNIVRIRDNIVISSKDPEALSVLGFIRDGVLKLPRVDDEHYLKLFNELFLQVVKRLNVNINEYNNHIVVFWNKYRKWMSEAILLLSLAFSCLTHYQGKHSF